MNDHAQLKNLLQTTLSHEQRRRLFETIDAIFKSTIDSRSPKKRPPGKAGLRAEKGYYRLLYLESGFQAMVNDLAKAGPDAPPDDWGYMRAMLQLLTDIPELRSEFLTGIESALDEILVQPPSSP